MHSYNFSRFPIRVCFVMLSFVLSMTFSMTSLAQQTLDKVIAVVNSQIITQSQLDQQIKIMQHQPGNPRGSGLRQKALRQLEDNALQVEAAKKAHIIVSEEQVNQTIASIAAQNNMTPAQLLKNVAAQGMEESAYRRQIRTEILIHEVQQKMVAPQVSVSPQDISALKVQKTRRLPQQIGNAQTAQYHLVDLLFTTSQNARQALKKLRSHRAAIHSLQDIKAILNQSPPVSAAVSDMGSRRLSGFPNIFSSIIKNLRPGEFSDPIEAPNGFHVLLLAGSTARYNNTAPVLSAAQIAYQYKFNQVLQTWLQKLRDQSYIKMMNH